MGIRDRVRRLLMRLLARSTRNPPVGPDTPREVLFPDERVRDEAAELRPFFDPFNFMVSLRAGPRASRVHDLLMAGDLKEAERETHGKLLTIPAGAQVSYLLEITSGVHELRHFHDSFGTTCGFARQMQVVRDAIEFSHLLDALKARGEIKVPLTLWARAEDVPPELKEYIAKRRKFIEWLNVVDGTMPAKRFAGHTDAAEALITVSLKGLGALIPAVPRNFSSLADGDYHVMAPLGARAVMEGNAFMLQRQIVGTLFGQPAASAMKDSQMGMAMRSSIWRSTSPSANAWASASPGSR